MKALAVVLALVAGAAGADETGRRLVSDAEAPALAGVGRLNVAGTRFCTAALISETLALTAAHCLYHPTTLAPVPLSEMRFVAGWRRDDYAALRSVARAAVPEAYRFLGDATANSIARDVALIELQEPVAATIAPSFPVSAAAGVRRAVIVSYGRDRAHAASIDETCRVEHREGGVAALECGVTFGGSGAPVFARRDGDLVIWGVVSSVGRRGDGRPLALAVEAIPWLDALRRGLERGVPDRR